MGGVAWPVDIDGNDSYDSDVMASKMEDEGSERIELPGADSLSEGTTSSCRGWVTSYDKSLWGFIIILPQFLLRPPGQAE